MEKHIKKNKVTDGLFWYLMRYCWIKKYWSGRSVWRKDAKLNTTRENNWKKTESHPEKSE